MNEKEFAAKLKPWLDRSAASLGEMQATKLRAARLRALDAFTEPVRLLGLVTVNAGTAQTIHLSILKRVDASGMRDIARIRDEVQARARREVREHG